MKKLNNMEAKLLSIFVIGLCGAIAFTTVIPILRKPIAFVTILAILILVIKGDK